MSQSSDKDGAGKGVSESTADDAVAGGTTAAQADAADIVEESDVSGPAPDEASGTAPVDHDDHAMDEHGHGSTLAGMALRFLIIVLVVFGLSLWLVPMIAPHLPASIARHIMPGQKAMDERLAAFDRDVRERANAAVDSVAGLEKQIAELTRRLAETEAAAAKARDEAAAASAQAAKSAKAAETSTVAEEVVIKAEKSADAAAEAAETATTAATEAGKVAAAATRDAASLARRMTTFEARVAGLSQELSAMGEALAKAPAAEGGGPSPELAAAFAALQAKVEGLARQADTERKYLTAEDADRFATQDDLRSARTALQAELKAGFGKLPGADTLATKADLAALKKDVAGRLGTIEAGVKAAEENAKAAAAAAEVASKATTKATGKVENAIRNASVRSAVAALTSRLQNGTSFAGALGELEKLTGTEAPAALKDAAANGVATKDDLRRGFGRAAQAAISADIRAEAADEGILGKAGARLRSVVAGRPKDEVEGDDTAAIVSRIEARLHDGALADALAESEALSVPAKEALADWLSALGKRVAADAAAANYIQELTRQQG